MYTYTMGYYSAIKKDEILPFAATWVDLEGNLLSEVSQRETKTSTVCMILFMCEIYKTKE